MSPDPEQRQRVITLYEQMVKTPCRFNYDELWDEDLFRRCVDAYETTLKNEDLTSVWEAVKGSATWEKIADQMKAGLPLWSRPGWQHELVGQPFDLDAALKPAVLLDDQGQDAISPVGDGPAPRVVLLLLFLVGCKFCEPIYPVLADLHASTPAGKLAVIASNFASLTPTPEQEVRAYVRDRKEKGVMPYDVYFDKDRSITLATAKRTGIPFTPNVFLFVDDKLFWHGDPDAELEEHTGFQRAVATALKETS